MLTYVFVARFPGCSDLQGLPVFEMVGVDGVDVALIEDKYVLIPS